MSASFELDAMENLTNHSVIDYGPKRDSLYIVIPITVIYAIIFVTGLIGNISTCIVIARNKSMHTATNYYLFSLAISDLLLLVSGLPQEIYQIWSRYPYVFGYTFCVLRGLFSETSANATVLTITAFTVERYVAICHPFLSHTMAKLSRIVKMIVIIWVVAIGFATPQALQLGIHQQIEGDPETLMCIVMYPIIEHSFEVSTFLFFCAPMTLITVLYILIGLKLRNSTNILNNDNSESRKSGGSVYVCPNRKISNRHQTNQSSKRVLKMLVAVVVAFFICWAPFHAQRLFAIYVTPSIDNWESRRIYLKIYEIMTYISGVLYYVSTTINPVLYNIMSNKFREAFKETFTKCCCGERIQIKQRTYSVLSKSAHRVGGQESTDSGRDDPSSQTNTTLVHKNSIESSNSKSRRRSTDSHQSDDKGVVTLSWHKSRSNVKLTVAPKSNYDNIQPNTKLVSVHVISPVPQRRLTKFVRLFQCLAKKTLDDGKRSPGNVKDEEDPRPIQTPDLCSLTSGEISNSSLKNVDGGSFKDELTYVFGSR